MEPNNDPDEQTSLINQPGATTTLPSPTSDVIPMKSINRVLFQKRVKDKWLSKLKSPPQPVVVIESDLHKQLETELIELEILKSISGEENFSTHLSEGQKEESVKVPEQQQAASPPAASPAPAPPDAIKKTGFTQKAYKLFSEFSVNPLNKRYYIWLVVISTCLFYNSVFLIARSAFWLLQDIEYPFFWVLIDYGVCDVAYLVDLFIRFFTSFMENGELCRDRAKIARRYMKNVQFKMDILSILPTDLIYLLYLRNRPPFAMSSRLLPALRLNRLFKFSRLMEFRSITETETKYPTIFRLFNLLLNILLAMHWNACIYFIVSNFIGFGHDSWVFPSLTEPAAIARLPGHLANNVLLTHQLDVQYIYCFWWSVQTLTTIAEVPPPTNFSQEIYMSVLLMIGVIILAITIGSASEMVENAQRENLELQTKCDYAKSYLKQNRIGAELTMRIKNYLNYLWIAKDVNQADVLRSLPDNLRKAIAMNVHMETLKRVHVFQDCEPGLLGELVTKLKLQIYSPGDYVCRKGDVGHEMYFIKTGKLQVVSPDGTKVFATLVAGAAFGEISILDIPGNKNGNKRTANIRSLGFSDVYQLSKNDLWLALAEYPVAKKSLMEKGKALLRKDNLLDEVVCEKLERKQRHLHEQVEYLQRNCLDKLSAKMEEIFKEYMEFLKTTKSNLAVIEMSLR